MLPTRRAVGVVVLLAFVAALSVVVARPLLFAGAILIGSWFVTRQVLFASTIGATREAITVEHVPERPCIDENRSLPVSLVVHLERPPDLDLEVTAGLPVIAASSPLSISIDRGVTDGESTVDVRWSVIGEHQIGPATVTTGDGLFTATFEAGSTSTVAVAPRVVREIEAKSARNTNHLTTADDRRTAMNQPGGVEPTGVRSSVHENPTSDTDWNATAQGETAYAYESDSRSTTRTGIVVDHREELSSGQPGKTKLDALLDVALAIARTADARGEPLGLLTVGDGVEMTWSEPATAGANERLDEIRRQLRRLETTAGATTSSGTNQYRPTAAECKRRLDVLEDDVDTSPFSAALVPFYRQSIQRDPGDDESLFDAVTTVVGRGPAFDRVLICTDDSNPLELYRAVTFAHRYVTHVVVALTPTDLYRSTDRPDGDRSTAFDPYRRSLERLAGASVIDVQPSDSNETNESVTNRPPLGEQPMTTAMPSVAEGNTNESTRGNGGRRPWTSIVAVSILGIAFAMVAGPIGAVAGLATIAAWYGLGVPYAIAIGHVFLVGLFPDGLDPASFIALEGAFVAVVASSVTERRYPYGSAVVALASAGVFGGLGWVLLSIWPLWLAVVTTLAALAFAGIVAYRYGLVRLDPDHQLERGDATGPQADESQPMRQNP